MTMRNIHFSVDASHPINQYFLFMTLNVVLLYALNRLRDTILVFCQGGSRNESGHQLDAEYPVCTQR